MAGCCCWRPAGDREREADCATPAAPPSTLSLLLPLADAHQPSSEPTSPTSPMSPTSRAFQDGLRSRDGVRTSFEAAARQLRETHSLRPEPPDIVLRHPEASGKRAVRVTTSVALGTDGVGRKCVNQYTKVGKLGRGSYGKVGLYISAEDGQHWAIKAHTRAAAGRRQTSRGASALLDALREVALLKLLDHANIVRLVEVIDDPGEERLYIVLEYLPGGPVLVDGAPPLTEAAAATAVRDVAAALAYCHWQGVCHGDVKPENMCTGEDGRVRLIDFSVAQLLSAPPATADSEGSSGGDVARTPGTPAYTAPECTTGGSFSGEAADVWALGASLFAMLTGAPPFVGPTLLATYDLIASQPLRLPPPLAASPVADLLRATLEKDPRRRASLAQVRDHPWLLMALGEG